MAISLVHVRRGFFLSSVSLLLPPKMTCTESSMDQDGTLKPSVVLWLLWGQDETYQDFLHQNENVQDSAEKDF